LAQKVEQGKKYPVECYAYAPDPAKPSTWRFRLYSTPDAEWPDAVLVGSALLQFRRDSLTIPAEALPDIRARLASVWRQLHPDGRLPTVLDDRVPARQPAKERRRDA